jgi:hypothetical protein
MGSKLLKTNDSSRPTIPRACEGPDATRGEAERKKTKKTRRPGFKTKRLVSQNEASLGREAYRQSAVAFAVQRPNPLAIMLRMTAQT